MCSIGGFISRNPLSKETATRLSAALLYYGSDRGTQSSGIFVNGKVLKKATSPDEFIDTPEFDSFFPNRVSQVLTHTRMPTSGGLGDAQAQPFKLGDVACVHNGWFNNCQELKEKWNLTKKSGVDSELAPQFIRSYGINKLPDFVKSYYGSAAFGVFYQGDLYLMRDGNPTAYTVVDLSDDNYIFIFASTGRMLANSIRHVWLLPTEHPIKETKDGILFRVKNGDLKKLSEKTESQAVYSFFEGHEHRFIPSGKFRRFSDEDDIRYFKPKYPSKLDPFEYSELKSIGFSDDEIEDLIKGSNGKPSI